MRELVMMDRFGIGWRPELAAGILSNLHDIDVVEVIAEDYLSVPQAKTRALRTLSGQVPVILHGVSLGMASAVPVETKRRDCRLNQPPQFSGETVPQSHACQFTV